MIRGWVLGLFLGCASVGLANPHFGEYRAAYEARMAKAETSKEVVFLTTRYDGALEKLHTKLVKSGKAEDAAAVLAERQRIRSLDKVVSAEVFQEPLAAKPSTAEKNAGKPAVEVELFGIKETCSRPVFLLHAGPAFLTDRDNPVMGRVRFDVARNRVIDAVKALPDGVEFNAALFWAGLTCPYSAKPMESSPQKGLEFKEWVSPVNMLSSEGYFGDGSLRKKAMTVSWPNRVDTSELLNQPKWIYSYQVDARLVKQGDAKREAYIHWVKALCFAFEQKADAVFIITPNLIFSSREDEGVVMESLKAVMESVYGKKRQKQPKVHIVMVARPGMAYRLEQGSKPVQKLFGGELEVVDDIEDWMTDGEKELFDSL